MIRHVIGGINRLRSDLIQWISGNLIPAGNLPTGVLVKRTIATPYTSNTNIAGTIPNDDTTPLDSEGTEILSVAHTMLNTTNRLVIRFSGFCATGAASETMIAAFFSSTATIALNSASVTSTSANSMNPISLEHEYSPGVTTSITFAIRTGAESAGGPIRYNGTATGRKFGGVAAAQLVIEELKA